MQARAPSNPAGLRNSQKEEDDNRLTSDAHSTRLGSLRTAVRYPKQPLQGPPNDTVLHESIDALHSTAGGTATFSDGTSFHREILTGVSETALAMSEAATFSNEVIFAAPPSLTRPKGSVSMARQTPRSASFAQRTTSAPTSSPRSSTTSASATYQRMPSRC